MGLLDILLSYREKRRRQRSLLSPLVARNDRDSFKYYDKGRTVTVAAEMLLGEYDVVLYRQSKLQWDDNGEQLTDMECQTVYNAVCSHFERKGIRWKVMNCS